MSTNVFIRQPFTESGGAEQGIIQSVMDILSDLSEEKDLKFLVPLVAEHGESFKANFEARYNQAFTPQNFRAHRLGLLERADAFINIRVGMSESSAFELGYHIFKGTNAPIFFAIWSESPIKTTLLRELDELNAVTYVTFSKASELIAPLEAYFDKITENQ